jgi:starch synthase (maltosyl-transferring)
MAPKIYHLHPLVAGKLREWPAHFARCRSMGFDIVCLAPPFAPGASGDIFVTADHESLHPALEWNGNADEGIARIVQSAAEHGLSIWLDLVIDKVAVDATIRRRDADWFGPGGCGGPPSPWRPPHRQDIAYARLQRTDVAEAMTEWWTDRLHRLTQAGLAGFRSIEPDRVPAALWRRMIGKVRTERPECHFLAWTPGVERAALLGLEGIPFDYVCSSFAWWDARASWLLEEVAMLRRIAPVIASPEPSLFERRAARLPPGYDVPLSYRFSLRLAAAISAGIFVPMGFEFATRRPFDAACASPEDFESARSEAPTDLSAELRAACELLDRLAAHRVDGELRSLADPVDPVTALLRVNAPAARDATHGVTVLANTDLAREADIDMALSPLPPSAGAAWVMAEPIDPPVVQAEPMLPGEVRIFAYETTKPIAYAKGGIAVPDTKRAVAARIGIEAITPSVPDGDFAVKRLMGEPVTVNADIIADGHEVIAAAVLWRADNETDWRRAAMRLVVNDRWEASFIPERIGRHWFTVEAWWDDWGTYCHDLSVKRAAGQDLHLEIEEGRRALLAAAKHVRGDWRQKLAGMVENFGRAPEAGQIEMLLSRETADAMAAIGERPFASRHAPEIAVEVDRPQAGFASWYEMFPRSATEDPTHHGTFTDVMTRLPAIRDMGFDVLYFPPVHPIGTTNRKGRNNALRAQPEDLGSPYAIGGPEGGHDAVHPLLGSLDDFRALIRAAKQNGLEIALDFAVQCSPDHPWLREHVDWFRWRPDGSLRYAENPPKKYEDIVNPDFYAEAATPALWLALRDVVQFWVNQGVRIFRVDNPHTKPLPFWRWMIADIRTRHPDVLFLSEAFTRPKLMYRLAKIGFTQSYTYFTWRTSKQEIIDYVTELNTSPVRDFFRPNFFVNTPDINPYFLQTSGRAGFLIRAALACTLSGLWGMYSGFEICEAEPLPGREEYLNAEKYEIRVRDFAAPGNIVREIAMLNWIRRAHPALQTHLGVTFYPAFSDQVLLYGKRQAGANNMILVAVSLDPHQVQEVAVEIPLWEWELPDHESLAATDLMRNHNFTWTGKHQTVRLDPADMPFGIWQIRPPGAL